MDTHAPATATATYDLMLLLDVAAEEKVRAGVLKEVQGSISSSGELLRHDRWGTRELAYPIDHKQQAEYHLLQFRPATTSLLDSLDRSLRITDGVIRFRIVKLKPGTPEPPPPPPASQPAETAAAQRPTAVPAAEERAGEDAAAAETAPAAETDQAPSSEPPTAEAQAPEAEAAEDSEPAAADTAGDEPAASNDPSAAGGSDAADGSAASE